MTDKSIAELRTHHGNPMVPVYFDASAGLDDPETMLHALRGVALALNEEDLSTEMDYEVVVRIRGLMVAAMVLANQLVERVRISSAGVQLPVSQ